MQLIRPNQASWHSPTPSICVTARNPLWSALYIQYVGYCLFPARLLRMRPTSMMPALPKMTVSMNWKPCQGGRSFMEQMMSAVAPPGGWVVRVNCMARRARDMPTAVATHSTSWSTIRVMMPTMAEMICPPIRFRGCAIFDSGQPYTSTALAPNEPMSSWKSRWLMVTWFRPATRRIPRKAPSQDQNSCAGGGRTSGMSTSPRNLFRYTPIASTKVVLWRGRAGRRRS
mmetsp:Transcript_10107/g.21618  ORF Transcript_10107/g.21618 Transcript_10107/m.21618 type:complete len:228 (-) Transcript_10107:739-1422(-)